MRIEVTNMYENTDFDIEPVCGTAEDGLREFFKLLAVDDILELKGYQFDLVIDDA